MFEGLVDKTKLAMAMANPGTVIKVKKLSDWVDSLLEAMNETDVKPPESGEFEDVILTLLKKAKIARIEDKNALVIELGKKKKLRLIASFKVVEDD